MLSDLGTSAFSILERIELGETLRRRRNCAVLSSFSILERIELGETLPALPRSLNHHPFSILERIELGETHRRGGIGTHLRGLSVSSNGSNWVKLRFALRWMTHRAAFSILERIELGETAGCCRPVSLQKLSVSSNGSNWVKLGGCRPAGAAPTGLSVSSNGSNWVKRHSTV